MIDAKLLLDNPKLIIEQLKKRRDSLDVQVIIDLCRTRKLINQQLEQLRFESKTISDQIGEKIKSSAGKITDEIQALKSKTQQIKGYIKTQEQELLECNEKLDPMLLRIPNLLHESVPAGSTAEHNQEVRRFGDPSSMASSPEHHEIGQDLGIIDFEAASQIAGSRFALLKGYGALLELALIQFMMDVHVQESGYIPIIPPYLVNAKTLTGTGQLPKFHEEVFHLEKDGYYLIPTAEVPVTNMYADKLLTANDLPQRFVAFSPCFRREAGSYGKDIKGLIRQHQFHKVELVKFCKPEDSDAEHESMVADAEKILIKLGLPYRVMALCSGDTGFSAAKCYDIEVWLRGSQTYREISSVSNCTDFQARRANIRYRPLSNGKTAYLHTLNGSGLAVGRTFIALLEYYWNEDGSVTIPPVLRPHLHNLTKITSVKS